MVRKNEIEVYSTNNEGSLFLLKDFLESYRIKIINTQLQHQKMCRLINWMM